jgi:hypothetical protein
MTDRRHDNLLIVHWHDTGRWLGAYGHPGVSSPRLDRLAAEGILFTRAHAAAPQCSPSRGAIFTGRYPHSNGLIGLAHHGFEYREGVRTLPQILSEAGWYSALFGMQHETSFPARLGFDEFDVSDSHCDHVVAKAQEWLTESAPLDGGDPFLLTAGFFETHRPWAGEYRPASLEVVEVPAYLPDVADVRSDLADFYGAIAVADAAVGRLLDTLAETGLDASTWVVFFTDHGAPFPRAKSMLYGAGTEISLIIRPPTRLGVEPRVYDELSAVSTCCRHCSTCSASKYRPTWKVFHTQTICCGSPRARHPFVEKCSPRRPFTTRLIRCAPSAPRNTATSRTTRRVTSSTYPWTFRTAHPGKRCTSTRKGRARRASSTTSSTTPTS